MAEEQPVLCTVDDAQWLDAGSADVISFVARRALADHVAIVCAVRTGDDRDDVLSGLPSLLVGGLGDADARSLLLQKFATRLDSAVVEQIIVESRGNPLALSEFPHVWTPAELAGGFGFPDRHHPLNKRLEDTYGRRIEALPT
jgi:hypothetical protein